MEPPVRPFLRDRPDQGGGGPPEEQSGGQLDHDDEETPCVLDIFVHEARGIHNICIYGDQDVYARLVLTSAPDGGGAAGVRATRGGGASPRFAERLPPLRVGRVAVDVLKCELWMRSCARGALDDQLLGFALVPLAAVRGAAVVEEDFELSSTDLLHSPAGTVRLSLALRPCLPGDDEAYCARAAAPEVVFLGPAAPAPPVDYSRIEFTDLRVEQENDAMAMQYLPFLRTGDGDGDDGVVAPPPETVVGEEDYCEMSTSPRGDKSAAASSDGSTSRNAAASTVSTVSEDRAVSYSAEEADNPQPPPAEVTTAPVSRRSPDTPTSRGGKATKADVFTSPLGDMDMDIDMEAEQSAMQRQIMEMYLKSMQQFSESLAKVQLPIELGAGAAVQKEEMPDNNKVIGRQQAKKDGARVFYGSRAFF